MEIVFTALGLVAIIAGLLGLTFVALHKSVLGNSIARALYSIKGREQSRAFIALTASAFIAFGAYLLLSNIAGNLPRWPVLVVLAALATFQIAAHLEQDDV